MKKFMEYAGVGAMMAAAGMGAYLYFSSPKKRKKKKGKTSQATANNA